MVVYMTKYKNISIGNFDIEISVSFTDHKHRGYEENIRANLSKNSFHIIEHGMSIYEAFPEVRKCLEGLFQDPWPTMHGKYGEDFDLKSVLRLITNQMCNEINIWILETLCTIDSNYSKHVEECRKNHR